MNDNNQVEPTQEVEPTHEVGVDQLFFSVTDKHGVITEANQVFVDLSRHDLVDLVGKPHNIIRYATMPSGTFHALWAALKKGQPFGAYMKNTAHDGSRYDVYATVTPLPNGGYLSVRSRPMCIDVRDVVFDIYDATFEHEQKLKKEGCNKRDVAKAGAEHLISLVQEAGFASYYEFQNAILPMEVLAREAASEGLSKKRTASGELGELQDMVFGIFTELDEWMTGLESLEHLSLMLRRAQRRLNRDIEVTATIVENLEQVSGDSDSEEVLTPLRSWAKMREKASEPVTDMQNQLKTLDDLIDQSRFTIALARLHTTMVAKFIDELASMETMDEVAQRGIQLLADALDVDIHTMNDTASKLQELAKTVNDDIEKLVEQLQEPLQVIVEWRSWVADHHPEELEELINAAKSSTTGAEAAIKELETLSSEVGALRTYDVDTLMEYIEKIRELKNLENTAEGTSEADSE